MRVAKFNIPVFMLTEFLNYIHTIGLKSTIVSKKEDVYHIEIPYTKEQASLIGDMEELVDILVVLTIASLSALSYLVEASRKSQPKKSIPTRRTIHKKHCFFKDFVAKNVKK